MHKGNFFSSAWPARRANIRVFPPAADSVLNNSPFWRIKEHVNGDSREYA
jgi:hypothetical protein